MESVEIKKRNALELLKSEADETFQIIETNGEVLKLKGDITGRDIKITMSEIFKGIDNKEIRLRRIPDIKKDGRRRN